MDLTFSFLVSKDFRVRPDYYFYRDGEMVNSNPQWKICISRKNITIGGNEVPGSESLHHLPTYVYVEKLLVDSLVPLLRISSPKRTVEKIMSRDEAERVTCSYDVMVQDGKFYDLRLIARIQSKPFRSAISDLNGTYWNSRCERSWIKITPEGDHLRITQQN